MLPTVAAWRSWEMAMQHTEGTIPTSLGVVTPERLVSELTYSSYAANRDAGMTPEAYASMFRDFPKAAYESRYQAERVAA